MKNIIKDILLAIGIVLILCGVVTLLFTNFNAANPILAAMGGVLASFRFLPKSRLTTIYTVLVGLGFAAFFAVLAVIFMMRPTNADGTEDAVIVLGCAVVGSRPSSTMVARTEAAYEYYLKNPKAVFVLSGGMGPQEELTEAEAMKKLLLSAGIPEDQLLLEEKATSTSENFRFSKEILDAYFKNDYKAAFVTNDFHCYRAGRLALIQGFDKITCIPARTPKNAALLCYVREVFAVVKLWVLRD